MEPVLIIAALIISLIVFTFVLRVVKSALSTVITLAIVVLLLQFFFGIAPGEIWERVASLWQSIWQTIR
jgi:hypothetical protein